MRTAIFFCALLVCSALVKAADDDLKTKCSSDFTKVMSCLSFVKATANIPTKECCSNVNEIRKDDPACLCYFVQMANSNDSAEQIKNMGVKISQLLLLPSACNVPNSNISECPTLLGLPANSPAAQVFTNLTATPPPSTGGTTTTVPTTTTASSGKDTAGSATGLNEYAAFLVAIIVAVSTSVFALA
ncbi:unnamed protein product [Rhodiola kirilowii]